MLVNRCDTHTHTLYSRHAYSTIHENVVAAREAGLELLGSADHFSCMLFPEHHPRNFQYFYNYGVWPREWEGVKLLRACEADIVDLDGNLFGYDIPVTEDINGEARPPERHTTVRDRVFEQCDYVVASVHDRSIAAGATREQVSRMYMRALNHPKVLMVGHISRSGLPFDHAMVIGEAVRLHKLIEINAHSLEYGLPRLNASCRKVAEDCAEMGCQIAVNTDAHISCSIGRFDAALAMLEEIHFPQELIATRSAEAFLAAKAAALGE